MEFILDLLESNVNYNSIIMIIVFYLFLLWLVVCFWVALDAKKRYKNLAVAIGFFLLVAVLNVPALVFYLIIRPEKDEDNILYLHSEDSQMSGVNVPIVNFKGDDGFVISLQLKVGNTPANHTSDSSNMNINVEWDSKDGKMMKTEKKEILVESKVSEDSDHGTNLESKVKDKTKSVISRVKNTSKSFLGNIKNYAKTIDSEDEKSVQETEDKK